MKTIEIGIKGQDCQFFSGNFKGMIHSCGIAYHYWSNKNFSFRARIDIV